jgi:predicted dehydrogenase
MTPLRIAVVGAGAIAQRNATEAARCGDAAIAGVFDPNLQAARSLARTLNVPVFASYEEALAARDVEAVLLSTPHFIHKGQTVAAAAAGKHVMVEKPMATTLADGTAMIEACRRAGVALTVNYSFRYVAKVQKARELVESGAIGDVTGIQIVAHSFKDPGYWMGARSASPDDWRSSREKCGGGLLIMNVCHTIDYLYFITGMRGTRVFAEYATLSSPGDVEDIASVTSRWGDRAVGTISASSIMRGADQSEERVWGTKGTLILDQAGLSFYSARPIDGRKPGRLHRYDRLPEVNWTAEWVRRFVRAVREGREPEVSSRAGWENLAFVMSAYDSLERRQPVDVPEYKP